MAKYSYADAQDHLDTLTGLQRQYTAGKNKSGQGYASHDWITTGPDAQYYHYHDDIGSES